MSSAVDLLVLDFCSRGRCSLALWKSLFMQPCICISHTDIRPCSLCEARQLHRPTSFTNMLRLHAAKQEEHFCYRRLLH